MILKSAPTKRETYVIKRLIEQGLSAREISRKIRVQYSSVANWVKHFRAQMPDEESDQATDPADDPKE